MSEPRTILPDARQSPRFAGIPTFCRYPRLEDVPAANRPVDWAIYGAPFDSGVTYRPGARFGPRSIRLESQYVKPYHIVHELMLTEALSLADAGDAPVKPFDCEANAQCVAEFAQSLPDPALTKLFMVGGDHSNTLANIRATWNRRGRPQNGLALIHFDSHLDTVDVTLDQRYSHASPFIRAVEEGALDPKRMLSIGIKGPLNTPRDLDYAKANGVTVVTYEQWCAEGTARIDSFLKDLGEDECYLTFDIDCLDPTFAPGTGTPCVGGFTSAEVLHLIRHLASACNGRPPNIIGADVVEVLPDRDVSGITSLLAAHIMYEIICLDGLRRRNQPR